MKTAISFMVKHLMNMGFTISKTNTCHALTCLALTLIPVSAQADGYALAADPLAFVEYCSTDYDTPTVDTMYQLSQDLVLISSTEDWNKFADQVANGDDFKGKTVKLTANIEVSTMVGKVASHRQVKAFSGLFDGCGHSIQLDITDSKKSGAAPFRYIDGATIRNLNVTGSNKSEGIYASGLVGYAEGTGNLIQNCQVSANINGASHVGGIIGNALSSDIMIEDCVFSGVLSGDRCTKGALFGWGENGGNKVLNNCLYIKPETQDINGLDIICKQAGEVSADNCYKTANVGKEGMQIYTDAQTDFCKRLTLFGHEYFAKCVVSGLQDFYDYNNGDPIATKVKVSCGGIPLVEHQDYDVVFKNSKAETVSEVTKEGIYEVIITPSNEQYTGDNTSYFRVTLCPDYMSMNGT